MTDSDLFKQHRAGDERAFPELIRRHLGWVYGVARRHLGDASLAEDVAQAAFILLHHKAPNFTADSAMIGWLHTTTWRAARVAARGERRRRKRETVFAQQRAKTTSLADHLDDSECHELAAMLDDLIERLPRADAQAVLLRYLKEMSFSEIAAMMEISAEAARKRVERAVGKLQLMAVERRIAASPAQINTQVARQMRTASPTGLTAVTAFAVTDGGANSISASVRSIIKGVQFMGMTKTALVVMGALLCASVASTAWQMMPAGVVPQVQTSPHASATQPSAETQRPAVEAISTRGEPSQNSNVPLSDPVNLQAAPVVAPNATRPPIVTSNIQSGSVVRVTGNDVIVDILQPRVGTIQMTLPGTDIVRLTIDLKEGLVSDLKPGMRLQAFLSQGTELQGAGFTVNASSPALTGAVVSVDPQTSAVTLIGSDAASSRVVVATNENTKVILFREVQGSPGMYLAVPATTVADLKPGMEVSVVPPTGIATSITMRPRTGPPAANRR